MLSVSLNEVCFVYNFFVQAWLNDFVTHCLYWSCFPRYIFTFKMIQLLVRIYLGFPIAGVRLSQLKIFSRMCFKLINVN